MVLQFGQEQLARVPTSEICFVMSAGLSPEGCDAPSDRSGRKCVAPVLVRSCDSSCSPNRAVKLSNGGGIERAQLNSISKAPTPSGGLGARENAMLVEIAGHGSRAAPPS
jgi:hypothetical protein